MPINSKIGSDEIGVDDYKKVIHVRYTSVSYRSYNYKEFIHLCDNKEVPDDVRDDLWSKILENCVDDCFNNYSMEEDADDVPDDNATCLFEEKFDDQLEDIKIKYGECDDCKTLLGPTTDIKIIAKQSYEKTICSDCCPDKATMRKEGWTEIDALSDDDSSSEEDYNTSVPIYKFKEDDSVEGCEEPNPEVKEVVISTNKPEVIDFFKDKSQPVSDYDELRDRAMINQCKTNATIINEATKAFEDLITITEESNIFVRKSVVNRMEELMAKLCKICTTIN